MEEASPDQVLRVVRSPEWGGGSDCRGLAKTGFCKEVHRWPRRRFRSLTKEMLDLTNLSVPMFSRKKKYYSLF